MSDHPLKAFIETTMEQMQSISNIKTVFGEPLVTADGITIIPVCKISCGFAAGGTEFGSARTKPSASSADGSLFPFGGGAGGGVSLSPFAFLVIGKNGHVQAIPLETSPSVAHRLLDMAPRLAESFQAFLSQKPSGLQED